MFVRVVVWSLWVAACAPVTREPPADDTDAADDSDPVIDTDPAIDTDDTDPAPDSDPARAAWCPTPGDSDDTAAPPIGGVPEPRVITEATGDVAAVVDGLNTLAWRTYGALADGDQVLSPLSLAVALGMTRDGAAGATRDELDLLLGATLPGDAWRDALTGLTVDLSGTSRGGGAQVHLTNQLFGADHLTWSPGFLADCYAGWAAPLEPLDIAAGPDAARQRVNGWADAATCGLVPELLPPGAITPQTALVLANALFVEADWVTEFDPGATGPAAFYLAPGGSVTVDMMAAEATVRVHDAGDHRVIGLPLQGGELGFWVVLPAAVDGLAAVEAALTPSSFANAAAAARSRHAALYFPRHSARAAHALHDVLPSLGVVTLFDRTRADLSAMLDEPRALWVDAIHQQAVIQFDEVGLRAAAATGVVVTTDSGGSPEEIRVDRPFAWVLRDELTGLVLFMGRTTDPTP